MRLGAVTGIDDPLPRGLAEALAGVDHILVAGGVGPRRAVEALRRIAPVIAVVGQQDFLAQGDGYPEQADVRLGGVRIVLRHLVGTVPEFLPDVQRLVGTDPPDVLVHGQAARGEVRWVGGTLFVCPGPARGTAGRPGSCALLRVDDSGQVTADILDLP